MCFVIDVHCHLNFNAFNQDYDQVIKEASEAGVTKIINVGTKIDTSQRAVELAEKHDNLWAIVGVHPHHADKIELKSDWLEQLEKLAKNTKVVGIGECGMDYYSYKSNNIVDPKLQQEVFIKQIKLAHKLKKPLQIHNRHAGEDIIEILKTHKNLLQNPPGMFHCMSGDLDFLKKVLDMGFFVGFDGNITYDGLAPGETTALADLVKATPIDRLLVETDSPYLTPVPFRGSRNTPKNGIIVAMELARIKRLTLPEIDEATTKNSHELFFPKSILSLSN